MIRRKKRFIHGLQLIHAVISDILDGGILVLNRISSRTTKVIRVLGEIIILGLCVNLLMNNYIFIFSKNPDTNDSYGVIDGNVTRLYDNVLYSSSNIVENQKQTHGDSMCEFISNFYGDYKVYYFNAQESGKITDESIILGLEWMKEKNIKKVNISLSNKVYSASLQEWITKNRKCITVYASYSNEKNTYDYPAMYKDVVGSTGVENEY